MDELMLARAKKGDDDALQALFKENEKRIYNVALRMMCNPADAMDMAQEAMLKIYTKLRSFKGESALTTWIYRITVNTCLDELRKRKNARELPIDEAVISSGDSTYHQAEAELKQQLVSEGIAKIDPVYRAAIVLRDIQGLSYDEIAEALGITAGTVKSRISRGRAQLAQILSAHRELFIG